VSFTGDLSELGQLAENLGRLARVPSRASAQVADEIRTDIEGEFSSESDPYGEPWEAHAETTVERWGEHNILDLSGEMKRSLDVRPMRGAGVSVTIDHPAGVHQTGWSGPQGEGPARPILPGDDFPEQWAEIVDDALEANIRSILK
jgi:hypothetical protein